MATPQTPFEARGHVPPWTSPAAEATYISDLLTAAPAIRREQVGIGTLGDPIYLYKIGTGPRHALIVSFQHANEHAPREATLTLIRDIAASTDPVMQAYLAEVTLLIMPTARPDGQWVRANPNGVNINRDHVQVTQAETVAIQQVISDYRPELVIDAHEGVNITQTFATSKALNQNVHPGLLALSNALEQSVKGTLEADGWTWEPYQGHNIYGPEYLSSSGGVRHAVSLLIESRRFREHDDDSAARYASQRLVLEHILAWHAANLAAVGAAAAAAIEDAPHRAEAWMVTGTGSNGTLVRPAPDGYALTAAQEQALARPINTFELDVIDVGEQRVLDARGVESALVHYLANGASAQRLVEGQPHFVNPPVEHDPDPVPWPRYYVRSDGRTVQASEVRLGVGGGSVPIWP